MRSSIIVPAGLADCKTQDLLHTVQGPDGPAALPEPNLIQRLSLIHIFAAGQRAVVDGEGHLDGGVVDLHEGQRLDIGGAAQDVYKRQGSVLMARDSSLVTLTFRPGNWMGSMPFASRASTSVVLPWST